MSTLTRREMLKNTLATAVGLSAGHFLGIGGLSQLYADTHVGGKIPTRRLGKTGFHVPIFSLGGQATIERRGRREESVRIIHRALDLGVRYIDTSHIYGGGISEEYIGEVMKTRRDEVFLATKSHNFTYDGTMRMVEGSLKRLQTDPLDLLQHHNISSDQRLAEVMGPDGAFKAFMKLQEEGVIKHRGISGHSPRVLLKAIEQEEFDTALVTLNPANISMNDRDHMDGFLKKTLEKDIGVIGMKVVGKGRLLQRPVTMTQAMRYTLSFPVATVIIGITDIAQVDENVRITQEFEPLDDKAIAEMEAAARG